MTKHLKLRPKKSYGKGIKRNPKLLSAMCHRHANGDSYRRIADDLGISYQHCYTLINQAKDVIHFTSS